MTETKTIVIRPGAPLEPAVRIINSGGIVAYPTETFYGLGCNALDPAALERLFKVKGRPPEKPVSVIIKDVSALSSITAKVPEAAWRLAERFWPGPLTLVLPASKSVPEVLTAGTGTIGVRVSGSGDAERFVELLDVPVTATSANPAGEAPPVTADKVLAYFDGRIRAVIDGGRLPGLAPSTIVEVDASGEVRLLREGVVPMADITEALEP